MIQVGVLLVSVAVAYNYSLVTLFQTADLQTPLACVSLVPAIALALAAIRAHPRKPEPPIYDRQVDYTIGIPLIVTALAVNGLLPVTHDRHVLGVPGGPPHAAALRRRIRRHHLRNPGAVAPETGDPLSLSRLALSVRKSAPRGAQRLHRPDARDRGEDLGPRPPGETG